jgi:hypothetical protein
MNRKPQGSTSTDVGRYLGYGLTWVASTLLFLYLGTRVDAWIGTENIFALLGALIGAAAGFYYMYFHLVVEPRRRDRDGDESES